MSILAGGLVPKPVWTCVKSVSGLSGVDSAAISSEFESSSNHGRPNSSLRERTYTFTTDQVESTRDHNFRNSSMLPTFFVTESISDLNLGCLAFRYAMSSL